MKWIVQVQRRNASHEALSIESRVEVAGPVDQAILNFLMEGWWIDRVDPISVTLRSPPDVNGQYKFAHFWREGF